MEDESATTTSKFLNGALRAQKALIHFNSPPPNSLLQRRERTTALTHLLHHRVLTPTVPGVSLLASGALLGGSVIDLGPRMVVQATQSGLVTPQELVDSGHPFLDLGCWRLLIYEMTLEMREKRGEFVKT